MAADGSPDDHEAHPHATFDIDPRHEHGLLYEAAIEAEVETGRHEQSEAEARASVIRRLARITGGFVVLVLGLAAIPLPGPGWLVVGLGLAILARDFVWAERMLNIVRKRLPQGEDGKIPTRTWVVIGIATACTVGASTWWSFFR